MFFFCQENAKKKKRSGKTNFSKERERERPSFWGKNCPNNNYTILRRRRTRPASREEETHRVREIGGKREREGDHLFFCERLFVSLSLSLSLSLSSSSSHSLNEMRPFFFLFFFFLSGFSVVIGLSASFYCYGILLSSKHEHDDVLIITRK